MGQTDAFGYILDVPDRSLCVRIERTGLLVFVLSILCIRYPHIELLMIVLRWWMAAILILSFSSYLRTHS